MSNGAISDFTSQRIILNFLYNCKRNVKLSLALVSMVGLVMMVAIPSGSALGQSIFIPNKNAISAGCRQDDYNFDLHLGLVIAGGVFTAGNTAAALDDVVRSGLLSYMKTVNPEWVNVQGAGNQVIVQGTVAKSFVSHDDFPTTHNSHDQNFDVVLDPQYQPYNSEANSDSHNVLPQEPLGSVYYKMMTMEWEINDFPKEFWPSAGDRAWVKGPLIWDCGHPPYETEIHPPTAVVFSHPGATFFKSNSLSPTAVCNELKIICNDNIPSPATITHIFISGHGGYVNTPVGGEHYTFDISLPPKPSQYAEPYVQVVSRSFDAVTAPSPTYVVDATNGVVHVDYDLTSKAPSADLRFGVVMEEGWKEAPVLTQDYHLLKVTIDSVQINKYHSPVCDSSPCNVGEWLLWVNIGGTWMDLGSVSSSVFAHPQSVQVLVPENGKLTIQTTGWNTNKGDYNLGVVKGSDLDILTALAQRYFGTSDITAAEIKALAGGHLSLDGLKAYLTGFKIGIIDQPYSSAANFGVGTPWNPASTINVEDPKPGPDNTIADFNLGYHITDTLYSKGSPAYKVAIVKNFPPPVPIVKNFPPLIPQPPVPPGGTILKHPRI
jgi:hypothetical protein